MRRFAGAGLLGRLQGSAPSPRLRPCGAWLRHDERVGVRDGDKFQQRRMWLPLTLTLSPRHIVLHVPNDSRYMPGGNAKAPDLFAGSRLQGRRLVRLTYLD